MCAAVQGIGGGLGWSLLPPLMPLIAKELGISHALGGFVWGMTPLGIALAAPLGGYLVDRFGPRRIVGVAMIFGALACAARALVHDPYSLALAMFVFGLHTGLTAPAVPKALGAHVAPQHLGRANGTALVAYTLGTAFTVLTARTVLAPALGGWRPVMAVAAILMALTGILFYFLVPDRAIAARHAGLGQVFALARDRQLMRVGAIYFLLFGGYLAMLGLLPRALSEAGLRPGQVAIAVASWLGTVAVANQLGPWLSDRLGRRRPFILAGTVVAVLAVTGLALAPARAAVWLLVVGAIGGGCFTPLLLALPLELPSIGLARAGGALGLLMLVGQAGGFLLPVACGVAVQAGGLGAAMGLLAVCHLLILIPAIGLRETGRAATPSREDLPGSRAVVA
jgi:OPA family glycerol-3-phosphate transporter-like MFS transporter